MTDLNTETARLQPDPGPGSSTGDRRIVRRRPPATMFAFRNISAVYALIALIVVFGLWVPDTFLRGETAQQILNGNAVTAIAALSIVIPLATRTFDLSFGGTMTLTGVTVAHLIVNVEMSTGIAVVIALLTGLLVGVVNAVLVVVLRLDSFIATLASGALIAAGVTMISGDIDITGAALSDGLDVIGQTQLFGVVLPVFYALALVLLIAYLMQSTAFGRRLYATGFNPDAARLSGVPTARLIFLSLCISGFLSGAAGVVLASTISAGSTTAGTPYLLTCFAAAFLGATQFHHGKFNAWGTVVAVLLLGTGVVGLSLAETPSWSRDLFTGFVLIIALLATQVQRRGRAHGKSGE